MSNKNLTIAYIGLSHLGLIHAVVSALKGFKIIGYHHDRKVIERLQNQNTDIQEPGLHDLLLKYKNQLHFTNDLNEVSTSDLVFISYDIPTDKNGHSDLSIVKNAIKNILPIMSRDSTLVLLSQVPPGFTQSLNISRINIYYQVETLIFGKAIERAAEPERLIVGSRSPNMPIVETYNRFLACFDCPINIMSFESAELTKISINLFLASAVTASNTLAEISEKIGANWADIKPSLKLDKRIGEYSYISPGLGISGGNLERDLRSILELGKENNTHCTFVESILANSAHRKNWLIKTLKNLPYPEGKTTKISILGLAYKKNTDSIKNSPSLQFMEHLEKYSVLAHDPVVKVKLPKFVSLKNTAIECIEGCDILVIATPWEEYEKFHVSDLKHLMRGRTIIDPFSMINYDTKNKGDFDIYCLGTSTRI
mgnify:FL=1